MEPEDQEIMSILAGLMMVCCAGLPAWEFDEPANLGGWTPNAFLADVAVRDGALEGRAVDWDPFFSCRDLEIPATPYQYVLIRMKADRSGEGELFWSHNLEGQYGGLSENKSTRFKVLGDNAWHEIVLFPFWHQEKSIRQLRLDVYDDARFSIDYVHVLEWGGDTAPLTDTYAWCFENGEPGAWRVHPAASDLYAPPLDLDLADRGWVTVRMSARQDSEGAVLWASPNAFGVQSESFAIRGDGKMRAYNLEVASYPAWGERIVALGVRLPDAAQAVLESVSINEEASGPPEFAVNYFGFENGANRAGRTCRVMAQFENRGGSRGSLPGFQLALPAGLALVKGPEPAVLEDIDFGDVAEVVWEVTAEQPGNYDVTLSATGEGAPEPAAASLRFLPPLDVVPADYVPKPHPIETGFDLCMYYFPGWNADVKWDCIRRVAPIRKPLLGYYDEANPECVDWQIKWAVENGINCFLVDWYWVGGSQHLTHWFDAYRQARYRDLLEVAIMWANHNPPNTHSREDWRNVTREWIDRYFNLPAYYKLNGKPAIFLWNPEGLRSDLGGIEEAKAALEESQAMAHAAGYAGIEFVAVNGNQSPALVKQLAAEGYTGVTNYHEWGRAIDLAPAPNRARFDDLANSMPDTWDKRERDCGALTYYPLLETGWDARPWHGSKTLVIGGRTVPAFERILRAGRAFSEARGKRMMVIGPANEWGEGSYIEPNTEFDFEMYEAVRRVFGQGDPASWPVNLSPLDVGRGSYDFPPRPLVTSWDFDANPGGWSAMMNVADLRIADGCLYFKTTSGDPAVVVALDNLRAAKYGRATVRMRIKAAAPADANAQLFWSVGGGASGEATSAIVPVKIDGEFHEYTFDLRAKPRWRSRISTLRFDPCNDPDAEIWIDSFALEP
jgi:hypothetical protein